MNRRKAHRVPTYGGVVSNPRPKLLEEVLNFVRAASQCQGVLRIALVGSLTTPKPLPKDADVLVTIADGLDLGPLAAIGRRLKGKAQQINLGADIFLANAGGEYLGRICHYRECRPRALCHAQHCGRREHLNDDLHVVTLSAGLIAAPPLELWPVVHRRMVLPDDVEELLLAKLIPE
jgi:hypothetical protein